MSDVAGAVARRCIYCGNDVTAWAAFRISASPFVLRIKPNGSNVRRFGCPNCGCNDRERHLRLYLERVGGLTAGRNGAVLHIAPELGFGPYLVEQFRPEVYVKGDLFPAEGDVTKVDVENMQFADATFTLVVCNHVLEHVTDPRKALREMFRVIAPGGRLICQTPFAGLLHKTFEDPGIQSDGDRLFFYGQEDHLRMFGSDIESLVLEAGFVGGLRSHDSLLPDVDPEVYGVNEEEPFFDFVKAAAPAVL